MNQTVNKINYAKRGIIWSIIIALFSAIVTITNPELRCIIFRSGCVPEPLQNEVELTIKDEETGETIAGVMVKVITKGPPEVQYTDSRGYTTVTIFPTENVHIDLSKPGYINQDFFINLRNNPSTTRTFILKRSDIHPPVSIIHDPPVPPLPTPNPVATYENDYIKASVLGASFDVYKYAQAGLIIENKTGKDLLIAYELGAVRAISDLGQSSTCALEGLGYIYALTAIPTPNPVSFSTLKPKTKITVSVTNCRSITPESKANSLSVNIPIVILENDEYKKFTIDLDGIPLPK